MRYVNNQIIRGLEKTPGVNLLQIAPISGRNILLVPKCGTRTIRNILLAQQGLSKNREAFLHIKYISKEELKSKYNSSNTIVPVRHPFDRLLSCWKQKVSNQRDSGLFYFWQYYPLLRPGMSFADFLRGVSKIPVFMREKHFIPLGYFFVGSCQANYHFIKLDALDDFFFRIAGVQTDKLANSTNEVTVSPEAITLFNTELSAQYLWELEMYEAMK
ncbi:sulfotransferase family protein [Porticoccaceae bacterium]|nr:sulfotransferase family protein [Porticoccaceae bacterium]